MSVHQLCVWNELKSLQERHLVHNGEPRRAEWVRCKNALEQLGTWCGPVTLASPKELVMHKRGARAVNRTKRALTYITNYGRPNSHCNIGSFIKAEPYVKGTTKAPRMIQAASDTAAVEAGLAFMPVEKRLWQYREHGQKVFAKGVSSFEVAAIAKAAWDSFPNPVALLVDHSKFDSCVLAAWIAAKDFFYQKLGIVAEALEEMTLQLFNKCYSKCGIKYECFARLMSGRYDTSLTGNLINWAVMDDVFRGIEHRKLLCGDDGVIFIDESDLDGLDLDPTVWARYGFKTEVDVVKCFEHIKFCQSNPVEVRPGVYRMVRDPFRAIARSCVTVKRYVGPGWRRLVKSKGMSEMACSDGVPVLQAWAEHMIRAADAEGVVKHLKGEISYKASLEAGLNVRHKDIHHCARESFDRAFGICATQQMWMENWSDAITNRILQNGI